LATQAAQSVISVQGSALLQVVIFVCEKPVVEQDLTQAAFPNSELEHHSHPAS
jgi:hypothetical protein